MENILILTFILGFGYVIFLIIENCRTNYYRKKIKFIVHVNGTRGKSSVTRMIAAGFRGCGYKVFSKTTGTLPIIINTKNENVPVVRKGKANIKEQIKMIRLAAKEGAEVLVLECMAVDPTLQWICQHRILKANICVITNARHDHAEEMGDSIESVATALGNTIPISGKLIVGDDILYQLYLPVINKDIDMRVATKDYINPKIDLFPENLGTVLALAESLNLPKNKFIKGMEEFYIQDPGVLKVIKVRDCYFINGMAINDPDSTTKTLEMIRKYDFFKEEDLTILVNNRFDRPYRTKQFIKWVAEVAPKNTLVMGGYKNKVLKELTTIHHLKNVKIIDSIDEIFNYKIVYAVGNFASQGYETLTYAKENGEVIYG